MSESYAPTRRANKIADWAETRALGRSTPIASHVLQELGAGHGYTTADIGLGLNTIKRRASLLGDSYPFRTAGGGVAARPESQDFVWCALLLMSAESPLRPNLDLAAAAEHLERITASALANLYGPETRSVRFAWPSEDGRPPDFPDAIRWLAARMNVSIGSAYRPPYRKDGGVDVVAWRPFPDGRSGFPVLLAQCTLEKDHAHKAGDIDLRVWSGWLALDSDPSTALAIAEVVGAGEEWNALAARTVILDRIRLCSLLDPTVVDERLLPVGKWIKSCVDELRSE